MLTVRDNKTNVGDDDDDDTLSEVAGGAGKLVDGQTLIKA